MSLDDNMEDHYSENKNHYDNGLVRIGCSETQARAYATYFRTEIRSKYYQLVENAAHELRLQGNDKVRVLDVGCGLGEDIRYLSSKLENAEFTGVELSETAVDVCNSASNSNCTFICGSIEDLQGDVGTYDLIISFCVLEHVASPRKMIKLCEKLLSENGLMVMAVPNHAYWVSWDLPVHLIKKCFGRDTITHSVKRLDMEMAICESDMRVTKFVADGFRPPQDVYKYIPDTLIKPLVNQFPNANAFMQWAGMGRILYLDMYCLEKCCTNRHSVRYPISHGSTLEKLSGFSIVCVSFLLWWGFRIAYLIALKARKVVSGK